MRVIYRKIRHARYLYIKKNVEKVWGVRYTLGGRYLSKNTVNIFYEFKNSFLFFLLRTSLNVMHVNSECTTHKNIRKQTGLRVKLV